MRKRMLSVLLALCLLAGILPFAAFAAEAPAESYVSVKLLRYVKDNIEGTVGHAMRVVPGEAKYVTTSAEGAIAEATASDAWNIKLECSADKKATLTLRGATVKGGTNEFPIAISANVDLTIVTETDSRIDTMNRAAINVSNSANTTVTGPGRLTVVTTDCMCFTFASKAGTTLIKDATLDLKPVGSSSNRMAITFTGGDLTIDNSKINIEGGARTLGIWGYAKYTTDAAGNVKVATTWKTGENDTGTRNLIIQNGSVITGTVKGRHALGATGNIIIKDSTVELSATGNFPVFAKKPTLEGECSAVGGSGPEKVVAYDESKSTSYKYFKVVPGTVDLIPTEPTTEPTTAPTTEPTTAPTTAPTEKPTVPAATEEGTVPDATEEATAPTATEGDKTQPAEKSGAGLWTAIAAVVVLAGSFALYWFVIKPKKE